MLVRVKLMGLLKEKTPPGGTLELSSGMSISHALDELEIPVDGVHVFTVNGQLVRDKTRVLAEDDELTVLPPVSGG